MSYERWKKPRPVDVLRSDVLKTGIVDYPEPRGGDGRPMPIIRIDVSDDEVVITWASGRVIRTKIG